MSSDISSVSEPNLEKLQTLIAPDNIAYYDLLGALPTRARHVCDIIGRVQDSNMLQNLLAHSKTLRAPHGKEFPIERVRNAIIGRIDELNVPTSQI